MMGRKKPKVAMTAGGRTPETIAKDHGDAVDQELRNPT
jgi:hypothetical protein